MARRGNESGMLRETCLTTSLEMSLWARGGFGQERHWQETVAVEAEKRNVFVEFAATGSGFSGSDPGSEHTRLDRGRPIAL